MTSFDSQLPEWKTKRLPAGMAGCGIECPRCHGKAIVNLSRWLTASTSIGRSCTYCFKTNRIPRR